MATPVCTTASLNVACLRGQELNRIRRLAFKIYYMANELKANGGTDYTVDFTNGAASLRKAAITLFGNQNADRDVVDAYECAIFQRNAQNAGASVSTNPNTVAIQTRRMEGIPEDDLEKMLVTLECALGRHQNPPTS